MSSVCRLSDWMTLAAPLFAKYDACAGPDEVEWVLFLSLCIRGAIAQCRSRNIREAFSARRNQNWPDDNILGTVYTHIYIYISFSGLVFCTT